MRGTTPRASRRPPPPRSHAMDIKDIMGIKPATGPAPKKVKVEAQKKPEGVSREAWLLQD